MNKKPKFKTQQSWRSGPANLFFASLDAAKTYGGFTYVMETDCAALAPNWLGELDQLCRQNQKAWIIGSVYRGRRSLHKTHIRHINGSSIYAVGSTTFISYLDFFLETKL